MSEPNWINLWDKLRSAVRSGAKWVGGKLLSPAEVTVSNVGQLFTPGDFQLNKPSNLHSTVSGTYATSELAQQYGADNIKFYAVEGSNQLNEVPIRRISIIVRKYNDGSVGLLFYDHQSGLVVIPGNLNLNENITGSIPKNNGEFVIRNGGSTSPDDPLFGDQTIDRALGIFTSSSSLDAPPAPTPQPTPAEQKQQTFQTSKLNISFTQMRGTTASPYSGDVIVKQQKTAGTNYYIINFYDTNGNKLGVADNNTSRQIWRSLWSGEEGGYKIPDAYLIEGDNDALGWLNRAFEKTPSPAPRPPPDPVSIFQTNTNEYKILFKDSSGNTYTGALDIRYQFDNGKWDYRVKKQGTNDYLTLTGDGVNITRTTPDGFPVYDISYEDGESFQDSFQSAYGGEPPTPAPLPPSQLKKIEINLTKGQTAIQAFNWDGTKSTPAENFTIHLEEQPDGSYQVYATGGSTDPNHNITGRLWVNLSYTGLRLNRLENGNWEIPAGRIPEGTTAENVRQGFLDAYYKPPDPTPPPPPKDNTPRVISTIDLTMSKYKGLVFTDQNGNQYTGVVGLYNLFQTDDEGKPLFEFHDAGGNQLKISVATGYHADELPELDQPTTGARRLEEDVDLTYEGDVGETIDEEVREFQDGYGISGKQPRPPDVLNSEIKIEGIILYKEDEEVFGLNKFQVDEFNTSNPQILAFCMYDPEYKKKEEINKYFDQSILTLDTEEKDEAPPMMGGGGGASEEPAFSGTFTSSGGEEAEHRHDLFSAPPAEYCQTGGGGRGRRLQACNPSETPDPPSHERSEHREKVHEKLDIPSGVSRMDLLNFEYNRAHEDDPKHGFFSGEGDPEHKLEYDTVKQTTDERELVSMYATFSDSSYVDDTRRPQSLFGMNYKPDESSNNFAVYTTPGGNRAREVVVSIRGTKPSNVTDLMSDALILTGYQDQLSVRFNEDLIKVKEVLDKYPNAEITLSSHSLGGAINDYIINELKGTKYENRIKAVSFNPGKSPNTKSERSEEIKELITDASIVNMSSIQRTLNINASDLAGGNLGTLSESQLAQYPQLSSSYQEMLGSLRGASTVEARQSIAEGWISRNRK
jgi:hypothetical protein